MVLADEKLDYLFTSTPLYYSVLYVVPVERLSTGLRESKGRSRELAEWTIELKHVLSSKQENIQTAQVATGLKNKE